jgi:hypothetical protein
LRQRFGRDGGGTVGRDEWEVDRQRILGAAGTLLGLNTVVPILRRGTKNSQLASAVATDLQNASGCGRRRLRGVINSLEVIGSTGLSSERSSTAK